VKHSNRRAAGQTHSQGERSARAAAVGGANFPYVSQVIDCGAMLAPGGEF
jgi:hypothetical protein